MTEPQKLMDRECVVCRNRRQTKCTEGESVYEPGPCVLFDPRERPVKAKRSKPSRFRVHVEQGRIHVNSIHMLQFSETAILMEADTRAKYPEIGAYSARHLSRSRNEIGLFLSVGPYTLKAEDSLDDNTAIWFRGLNARTWSITADVRRYSVAISLIRKARALKLIWSDEANQ